MLPIHRIIWNEWREKRDPVRVPEPEAMVDPEQIRAYVKAYEWGGPTSALQLYHLEQLSGMLRPGDTVLDLACGPGPLLLELARLYPDCRFIGADLSEPMLAALEAQATAEGLTNIETRCEDIRTLSSLADGSVDVAISTSALHHLPDLSSLKATFECAKRLMRPGARLYFFDFGLLRSTATRQIMVREVAKLAPPVTAKDYQLSLDAAYPIHDVVREAATVFGESVRADSSSFVDFFYFLRSRTPKLQPAQAIKTRLTQIRSALQSEMRMEHLMLSALQRRLY